MSGTKKTVERITAISSFVGILGFCLFLILPSFDAMFDIDEATPLKEMRMLNTIPGFPKNLDDLKEFPATFEDGFNDQFGFRNRLLRLNSYLHVAFLSTTPLPEKVVLGNDRWLYYSGEALNNYRHFPGASTVREWRDMLQARHEWHEKHGIKFLFVIAPDKHSIYPENIPEQYSVVREKSMYDELIEELKRDSDVSFLDLRAPLIAHKEPLKIYEITGTHWNLYGAYVACDEILKYLSKSYPEILEVLPLNSPFDDKNLVEIHGADLAKLLGMEYSPLFPEQPMTVKDHRTNFSEEFSHIPSVSPKKPNIVTRVSDERLPRGVLFRDSFASRLVPYLSEGFSELSYIWQDRFDKSIVLDLKPDIVIQEIAERKLMSNLVLLSEVFCRELTAEEAKVETSGEYKVCMNDLSMKGEKRKVVLASAPTSMVFKNIEIPHATSLSFGFGMHPRSWYMECDGVEFIVRIKVGGEEANHKLFSRRLNPCVHENHQGWFDCEIDLSKYGGSRCDLYFETVTGSDPKHDYSFWTTPVIKSL